MSASDDTRTNQDPAALEFEPENAPEIELEIDGLLDLHTFNPRDVRDLVPEYVAACREKGILDIRIIHGKGTGTLRRTVHAILDRLPDVDSYTTAPAGGGGWGATIVRLKACG